jgi:hypothetical protein
MPRLVTGLFYSRSEAERAVDALKAQGIPAESIYLETEVMPDTAMGRKGGEVRRAETERRFAGMETGLIIGLIVGALAGIGTGILGSTMAEWARSVQGGPTGGIPAVLASPVLAGLVGAILGLIAGGIVGWVVDFTLTRLGAGPPLPAEETLVTVRTSEETQEQVYAALFDARARHLHVASSSTV